MKNQKTKTYENPNKHKQSIKQTNQSFKTNKNDSYTVIMTMTNKLQTSKLEIYQMTIDLEDYDRQKP